MDQNAIDKARAELRLRLFGEEPAPTKPDEEAIARILDLLFQADGQKAVAPPLAAPRSSSSE